MNNAVKIEKQVARWDLYAKIAPTFFLTAAAISLAYGITSFDTLFNIGMIVFALTAVVWWFWTIFTVRYIIRLMSSATQDLVDVKQDLKEIRKEFQNDSN
jgi:hypothetical protein